MELNLKKQNIKNVLDTHLQKIVWFMNLPYSKIKPQIANINKKVEKDYYFNKLKGYEKRFANWFMNMSFDDQIEALKRMTISISEPIEPIGNFFSDDHYEKQKARFFGIKGKDNFDYLPIEIAVFYLFSLFVNNYSGLEFLGLSEKYPKREIYDFDRWAKFYLEISDKDKLIIINYISENKL